MENTFIRQSVSLAAAPVVGSKYRNIFMQQCNKSSPPADKYRTFTLQYSNFKIKTLSKNIVIKDYGVSLSLLLLSWTFVEPEYFTSINEMN